MCWLIRLGGFLLMFFGLQKVFKPFAVLGDVLPVLGNVVGMGTSIVSFFISLPCALVTIAIAWLVYRPVLGIALLAAAGGMIVFFLKKKKAAAKAKVETQGSVQA